MFALSHTYGKADLLTWARELNPGFDLPYFIEALDALPRCTDVDLSLGAVDVAAVRTFFSTWAVELRQDQP